MTEISRAYGSSALSYPHAAIRLTVPKDRSFMIERYKVLATRSLETVEPFAPDGMTTVWEIDGRRAQPWAMRADDGATAVLWVFCREPGRVFFWATMNGHLKEAVP